MRGDHRTDRVLQLDSVRGVAIVAVLAHHYFQWSWGMFSGRSGVILFFILSGYFITGILLRWRSGIESGEVAPGTALRLFYLRRALRIFPAYYLVLTCAAALGVPDVREYFGWHAAYLSNVLFALRGDWLPNTAHFWSLAVEEQFYLVWPLIVWWTPRRWLIPLIAACIGLAPLSRLALLEAGFPPIAGLVMPFCVTDALGLGALLACMRAPEFARQSGAIRSFVIGAAASGFILYWLCFATGSALVLWETFLAFALGAVVLCGIEGRVGGIGRLLSVEPLARLGRISYGVYLIHLPITHVTWRLASWLLPAGVGLPKWILIPAWAAGTIALAALSWRYFEQPILAKAPRPSVRAPLPAG